MSDSSALKRAWIQSLLLHGALAAAGWWLIARPQWLERVRRRSGPPGYTPQAVTLLPAIGASRGSAPSTRIGSRTQPGGGSRPQMSPHQARPSLGLDFRLTIRPGEPRASGPTQGEGSPSGSGSGRDGYAVANSMGYSEEAKLYPFFRELWKRVDASTGYPSDFAREYITGNVSVQFVGDRKGVFTGELLSVKSDQPLLEAYVLAVLLHALREPLPARLWTDREEMILVTRFEFMTFTYGSFPPLHPPTSLKNVLAFHRSAYVDPKVNEVIKKALTEYFPPVIVFPGGGFVDFVQVYQFVQNYRNRNRLNEAGLRQERIRISREQWEGMVRNGLPTDRTQ